MRIIIGIPSGEIIYIRDRDHEKLAKSGYITWVSTYDGEAINKYCFYDYNSDYVYNLIGRSKKNK